MLKYLLIFSLFSFSSLSAANTTSSYKLYENMLSICLEDQPEELCICIANSFRSVVDSSKLTDEEYELLLGTADYDEAKMNALEAKIDFATHDQNVAKCISNYEMAK